MSDSHDTKRTTPDSPEVPHRAGAFDIRVFIAALIGIYGVVLVIAGVIGPSDAALRKTGGWNINLYAGTGMLLIAGFFIIWARLRPVVVPPRVEDSQQRQDPPAEH
jgi:hypothetical protein